MSMLAEEMEGRLPEAPAPEKLEAWYHSEVTQWFIAEHLKLQYMKIAEEIIELNCSDTSVDAPFFYKFQGAARNIEALTEIIEGFRSEVEGEDV